jgi:hypothetical protein
MSAVLLMGVASLSRRPRSCACKRCAQPRTLAKTARWVRNQGAAAADAEGYGRAGREPFAEETG